VLLLGNEPNVRWRTFTGIVIELARELGVELVVSLGALLADVPHTRPAPVTGAASDAELVERMGLQASRYEGPTGIIGVLHEACREAGIPSISFWAAVPHYVSLAPSPRAALALCERLAALLEIPIDVTELEAMVDGYTTHVSEAVSSDEDAVAYVDELEQRADMIEESDLPSGDTLAAELTRFLREREQGDTPPDAARGQ
jgi:predicted ATP-grasp superfamily ATP-dependent carboligase